LIKFRELCGVFGSITPVIKISKNIAFRAIWENGSEILEKRILTDLTRRNKF
jgi:hypothetical protein